MNTTETCFSDIYLKFTDLYSRAQVKEEEPKARIPEKVVRCIWNDQLIKTDDLATTDGETLEVIFPGYWNFGPGPDFNNGIIKVNGKIYHGDVEIHVYSGDWRSHKHSGNADYDNVILHVFLWNNSGGKAPVNGKKRKKPSPPAGAHIFELELKDFLEKGILHLKDQLDFDNYPIIHKFNYGLCHEPLARLSKTKLDYLLNSAAEARVLTKMGRYHDRVILRGYEQTFYEGLAEALGYPINKKAFQNVAEALPLAKIKGLVAGKLSDEEKVLHVQAMLFGVSGLIELEQYSQNDPPSDDEALFEKMNGLWKKYKKKIDARPMDRGHWKFGGIRPANFPYRRLAGLAHLVVRHWNSGIFGDCIEEFKSAVSISQQKGYTDKTARKFNNFFCVETEDYWAYHYSPGGRKLSAPQKLVGPARSKEIAVNILIPIGLIYARASRSASLEKGFSMLFQSGRGPADNKLIRFMKHYIFGDKKEMIKLLTSDKQGQGLMQVYQDFCTQNENNCLTCSFPGVVEKYFS